MFGLYNSTAGMPKAHFGVQTYEIEDSVVCAQAMIVAHVKTKRAAEVLRVGDVFGKREYANKHVI